MPEKKITTEHTEIRLFEFKNSVNSVVDFDKTTITRGDL